MTTFSDKKRRARGPERRLREHRDLAMLWSQADGLTASAIADQFAKTDRLDPDRPPSLRTIQRWIDEAGNNSGPEWTLATQLLERSSDATIVLRALGTLAWASGRRPTLSTEAAEWTIRIARAAPTIDPFIAYKVGILYRDRVVRGQDTGPLDVYLGAAPWENDKRYLAIIENGAVDEWFGLGWNPPLELVIREHYARQDRSETPG
jgi:hypothetical protein